MISLPHRYLLYYVHVAFPITEIGNLVSVSANEWIKELLNMYNELLVLKNKTLPSA